MYLIYSKVESFPLFEKMFGLAFRSVPVEGLAVTALNSWWPSFDEGDNPPLFCPTDSQNIPKSYNCLNSLQKKVYTQQNP